MEPNKELNAPKEEIEETKELTGEELSQIAGGGKPIPLTAIKTAPRNEPGRLG